MYGEKILDSAADGMKQLFSLFLLKMTDQFYSCLEMWAILHVQFSKCIMIDLIGVSVSPLKTTYTIFTLHLVDLPVLIYE